MKTILYRVRTTWPGADKPSEYYFDTRSAAELNLMHTGNGEIERVEITSDYELNYHDGCTYDDLTYGMWDAAAKEV